jgi:transposase InsO family protein
LHKDSLVQEVACQVFGVAARPQGEPVTLRRVRTELTIAMDLYSRAITGLRLSPVSTKSADAA